MTPSPKAPKISAPVRTFYVRQSFRKSTGNSGLKKRDLPHFYANTVLQDQTALGG